MAVHRMLVAMVAVALLSLGGGASQPARTNDPWLELPQAGERVEVDGSDGPPALTGEQGAAG